MLCTNCKKENAVFFYSQSINGKESSVALCHTCSKKFNMPSEKFGIFEPFFNTASATQDLENFKKCNLCGLNFNDIKRLGKVGCHECYNTFSKELKGIIQQIHGNAKHCGTAPAEFTVEKSELEITIEKLNEAISSENYEEAALLRDKIKVLKGERNE